MDILFSIIVTWIGTGIAYLGLDKSMADKISLFRKSNPDETFDSKIITGTEKTILLVLAAILCFAAAMRILDRVSGCIGTLKMLLCLLCLLGAACFDYREHRIPNVFPAAISIAAIFLLGAAVLLGQEGAVAYITTSAVAAATCGLILVAVAAITRQGIGAGDIKLICSIALMTGVYTIMGTLFFGIVLCSLYGAVALISKKKTVSGTVPFGPFLLLGYVLTLFFINF